jgi:alginate O-acetyltransferase complex protein AlgI
MRRKRSRAEAEQFVDPATQLPGGLDMAIGSLTFLVFAALVIVAWHLLPGPRSRSILFLTANLAFCATMGSGVLVFVPLLVFLLSGYAAVKIRARCPSGGVLALLVGALTLAFCWLKQYWFLAPLGFLHRSYTTVGLSYVFFRVVHLVIDARDAAVVRDLEPLAYANYTLNFTSLIAGPIQYYQDFARPPTAVTGAVVGAALERVIGGLLKLVIIGPMLIGIHHAAVARLTADAQGLQSLLAGVVGLTSYPVYLYFNFSGYMDIVIGIGRLIGLQLPENFNRPFTARNFTDFWARYHMTLSGWLRDYVYTPLLRVLMTHFDDPSLDLLLGTAALFVTFLLIGVWHGPTLMFALYGILLAVGAITSKLYQAVLINRLGRTKYRALALRSDYQACSMGLTFTWYVVSMVCFWATGHEAVHILRVLGVGGSLVCIGIVLLAASVVLPALERGREVLTGMLFGERGAFSSPYVRAIWSAALACICVIVRLLGGSAAPDVVYRTF